MYLKKNNAKILRITSGKKKYEKKDLFSRYFNFLEYKYEELNKNVYKFYTRDKKEILATEDLFKLL